MFSVWVGIYQPSPAIGLGLPLVPIVANLLHNWPQAESHSVRAWTFAGVRAGSHGSFASSQFFLKIGMKLKPEGRMLWRNQSQCGWPRLFSAHRHTLRTWQQVLPFCSKSHVNVDEILNNLRNFCPYVIDRRISRFARCQLGARLARSVCLQRQCHPKQSWWFCSEPAKVDSIWAAARDARITCRGSHISTCCSGSPGRWLRLCSASCGCRKGQNSRLETEAMASALPPSPQPFSFACTFSSGRPPLSGLAPTWNQLMSTHWGTAFVGLTTALPWRSAKVLKLWETFQPLESIEACRVIVLGWILASTLCKISYGYKMCSSGHRRPHRRRVLFGKSLKQNESSAFLRDGSAKMTCTADLAKIGGALWSDLRHGKRTTMLLGVLTMPNPVSTTSVLVLKSAFTPLQSIWGWQSASVFVLCVENHWRMTWPCKQPPKIWSKCLLVRTTFVFQLWQSGTQVSGSGSSVCCMD